MKSILPLIGLCLGIGLSSHPASAGPFDVPNASNPNRDGGTALRIHHVDHSWRAPTTWPSAIRVAFPLREAQSPWASFQAEPRLQMASPRILGVVAGIPEPSASVLFGVGLVLALQAFPRRTSP